jgi:hypothetical protein
MSTPYLSSFQLKEISFCHRQVLLVIMIHPITALIFLSLFLPAWAQGPEPTLSIWSEDGFDTARACVTGAFTNWDEGGLWNGALQCSKNSGGEYLNACVCRADLQPLAESYISSYVASGCSSNTVDIRSGISLYENYCTTATATTVQTTLAVTATTVQIAQSATEAVPTVTATLSNPSTSSTTSSKYILYWCAAR